jgi:hypothetical protein
MVCAGCGVRGAGARACTAGQSTPTCLAAAPHLGCRVLVWHRRPLVLLRHRQHDLRQQAQKMRSRRNNEATHSGALPCMQALPAVCQPANS